MVNEDEHHHAIVAGDEAVAFVQRLAAHERLLVFVARPNDVGLPDDQAGLGDGAGFGGLHRRVQRCHQQSKGNKAGGKNRHSMLRWQVIKRGNFTGARGLIGR